MQALFGVEVPFGEIVGCRVNRLRVKVRGIETAVARVALGGKRTQVWLTLASGQQLTSIAKDDPAHAQALEEFVEALEVDRVQRWLAALERGEVVQVGKVSMTREQITVGRKSVRWADIGGHAFRDGGFMVDGLDHRLVFHLWVAKDQWVGAIARMVDVMAPGRDYGRMSPASLPRMGFFATSALTHVPGALTMRARGYLLLGFFGGGAVIAGIVLLVYSWQLEAERASQRAFWTESIERETSELLPELDDPAFASLTPCERSEYRGSFTYLTTATPSGASVALTEGGRPIEEPMTYPSRLLVWKLAGEEMRGVLIERAGEDRRACSVAAPGTDLMALLGQLGDP